MFDRKTRSWAAATLMAGKREVLRDHMVRTGITYRARAAEADAGRPGMTSPADWTLQRRFAAARRG